MNIYKSVDELIDMNIPYGEKASLYGTIILLVAVAVFIAIKVIKKKKSQG